jgi:hypothetical protein
VVRRIATGFLVLSALATTAAWAVAPPPTGTLACGSTGSVTLKPGDPGHTQPASTKNISVKVHNGAVDTCNNAGVTGGKLPINGGVITFNGKIPPGATCDTLLSAPPNITKPVLVIKLTGTNPKSGKPSTVAVIKPTNLVFSVVGTGFHIVGDVPQTKAGNKPFGNETFEAQLNTDNIADAVACISGPTPLTHIDFSTAGGSTISVHP